MTLTGDEKPQNYHLYVIGGSMTCANFRTMVEQSGRNGATNTASALTTTRRNRAMADKALPSAELIRQLLRYEPETGNLFWKERPEGMFPNAGVCKSWNTQHAGKQALTCPNSDGYLRGSVLGHSLKAHRVAWLITHGKWPLQIDHINGVRDDNRICNLREASQQENCRNFRIYNTNASGVMGVRYHKSQKKWHASINVRGKRKHLGSFDHFDDAVVARKGGEAKYDYHKNHGI